MAVSPGQRRDPYHEARMLLAMIPEEIRKSASPGELAERLSRAQQVAAQAGDMRLDPLLRSQAKQMAQQVLTDPARPAGVRKAAPKGEPIPVFNQAGELIGVVMDPSDLTPVSGTAKAPSEAQQPAAAPQQQQQDPGAVPGIGQQVAKSSQVVVYDQHRRPYLASRRNVLTRVGVAKSIGQTSQDVVGKFERKSKGKPKPGENDSDDQGYGTGVDAPEVQARRGSLGGGTTGLGQPRQTGPAAALPFDGPQQALPGDVPGRTVIKSGKAARPAGTRVAKSSAGPLERAADRWIRAQRGRGR